MRKLIQCCRYIFGPLLLALAITTVCAQSSGAQSSTEPQTKLDSYLSLGDAHDAPTTERLDHFNCSDKIFSVLELKDYPHGDYRLEVRWIDPTGEVRERTQYPFNVQQAEVRLWAWLSLSRARGASILQWLNPSAGMEEFIGPWQAKISLNDKLVKTLDFEISC